MNRTIDLGDELLIDATTVRAPEMKLLLSVFGQPAVQGSVWIAVDKRLASRYPLPLCVVGAVKAAASAA